MRKHSFKKRFWASQSLPEMEKAKRMHRRKVPYQPPAKAPRAAARMLFSLVPDVTKMDNHIVRGCLLFSPEMIQANLPRPPPQQMGAGVVVVVVI